ncbi:hypothetical protein [Globicatella sp. PHS-GS-PNBC-21-1553]|uniref:hypothetical protein n=1 Tax=Globicatella sp. PHS-GS-PNBC-21-1553 TaxID=2885764 RepID=UPI00298F0F6F|nr:hypothetical protein [Globicatella sp. PHS-GS-PNBC-21-1553]WPC08391.1 hypothetical protein LB888_10340 [Globicatella sp. PHS-GS-PNBC-21-1553]
MKKCHYIILIVFLIMMIVSNAVAAQAVELAEPYQLITQWEGDVINQENCQILIQNQFNQSDNMSELNQLITDYQTTLSELEIEFNRLTSEIESLENNENYSITQATNTLNEVIEGTYLMLQTTEPEFNNLTEAEQLSLVEMDQNVIDWQHYLEGIIQQQNEVIASRSMVETQYHETLYLLEVAQNQLAENQIADQQLNQCLLYAYSVPKLNAESFLMDHQMSSLTEYLATLDFYLSQLVPYPYYQLRFEDIYQQFTQILTLEEITQILNLKGNIQLDDDLKNAYQYREELSLNDVVRLVSIAQNDVYQRQTSEDYLMRYQELLLIKEAQFIYFSQINANAWQLIKDNLANFLNSQGYVSDDAIALVRQLNQKYQVKLVTFNEATQTWQPVEALSTCYLAEYYHRDIDWHMLSEEETTNTIEIEETNANTDVSNIEDTKEDEAPHHVVDSSSYQESHSLPKPLSGSRYSANRSTNTQQVPSTTKSSNNTDTLDNIKAKLATNQKTNDNKQPNNKSNTSTEQSNNLSSQKKTQSNKNPSRKKNSNNQSSETEASKTNGQQESTSKSNKNQTVQLPTTGEQQRVMTWALILLMLGAILILISTIYKRKQRQKLDEIDLDA